MFKIRDLSVIGYANFFTLWHYKDADNDGMIKITSQGYFKCAYDLLTPGDLIIISGRDYVAQRFVAGVGEELTLKTLV